MGEISHWLPAEYPPVSSAVVVVNYLSGLSLSQTLELYS